MIKVWIKVVELKVELKRKKLIQEISKGDSLNAEGRGEGEIKDGARVSTLGNWVSGDGVIEIGKEEWFGEGE